MYVFLDMTVTSVMMMSGDVYMHVPAAPDQQDMCVFSERVTILVMNLETHMCIFYLYTTQHFVEPIFT